MKESIRNAQRRDELSENSKDIIVKIRRSKKIYVFVLCI